MSTSVIVWDLETVPDLRGLAMTKKKNQLSFEIELFKIRRKMEGQQRASEK